MKFFRKYAESFIYISDSEWNHIADLYTLREFKKGENIIFAGGVCTKSYYLSSGVARSYSIDHKNKDFTWMLHLNIKDNISTPFLGDYVSLITKDESDIFCEAITDCVVYIADYQKIEKLYESELKWMTLAKKVAESNLVLFMQYHRMLKRLDAKEKYKIIMSTFPMYADYLPDYQFASLLDIAPQSLSRIKKEFKQGKEEECNF